MASLRRSGHRPGVRCAMPATASAGDTRRIRLFAVRAWAWVDRQGRCRVVRGVDVVGSTSTRRSGRWVTATYARSNPSRALRGPDTTSRSRSTISAIVRSSNDASVSVGDRSRCSTTLPPSAPWSRMTAWSPSIQTAASLAPSLLERSSSVVGHHSLLRRGCARGASCRQGRMAPCRGPIGPPAHAAAPYDGVPIATPRDSSRAGGPCRRRPGRAAPGSTWPGSS